MKTVFKLLLLKRKINLNVYIPDRLLHNFPINDILKTNEKCHGYPEKKWEADAPDCDFKIIVQVLKIVTNK